MSPEYQEDDTASENTDDGHLSGDDMDIDPELPVNDKKPDIDRLSDIGSSGSDIEDDDFPEPVIFSDDDFDSGHDDLDDGYTLRDNLKAASGFKVRKKPKSTQYMKRRLMRASDKSNDPEVRDNISKANEAFVRGDLSTAWRYYIEVIKLDAKNFNAYRTLGEICQMREQWNKCCSYWLLAAECGEADGQFWAMVAELSASLGYIDQAIHCYNQAISKTPGVPQQYITERALLYKEKKQFGRALEGFQKLHQTYPTDTTVVRQLASIYAEQKRVGDAINLYMRILDSNIRPSPNSKFPVFNWTELNVSCELLATEQSWESGIRLIKLVSRWKQDRSDETWWDELDDDSEFDVTRRRSFLKSRMPTKLESLMSRDFDLPIDIRFKLGMFRLELNEKDEALSHFNYLFLEENKSDVFDLFFEAGSSMEAKGYPVEAISFLTFLFDNDTNQESNYILGKCLLEIRDYEAARTVLLDCLNRDPQNLDVKLSLIEALYYTQEMEYAAKLMEDVTKTQLPRNKDEKSPSSNEDIDVSESILDDSLAIIKNSAMSKRMINNKMEDKDPQKIEANATKLVKDKYNGMLRLQDAIDQGHHAAATAWLKLASQLFEIFMVVKSFFPKNRKTAFNGIMMYHKRKLGIDDRIVRISNIVQGMSETDSSRMTMTSKTEFRGLDYDTWLWIFVQYAYLTKQFENNLEEAIQIIEIAFDVSVFVQDKIRSMLLRLVRLNLGICEGDYAITVSNNVRYLLTSSQFSPSIYDFFMCCFSSGVGAWAAFSNYNHQKYFLRHLKAYDSLLTQDKVSGSAQITVDVKNVKFEREHPHLLYIYACLLGSNRTYSSPIVYLTRAYRQYYHDPTICFMLGLAHIHRSMQRNSGNRQIQLLQGISYLMEYKSAREKDATVYEQQEIEYNFGRTFHMIGLTSLAIKHYEKALYFHDELKLDPTYDMSVEAAYNLSLIYTINGNSEKSRNLYEKYLTV